MKTRSRYGGLVNTDEDFWKHVNKDGPNGCWIWTGSRDSRGYGRIRMNGSNPITATRYMMFLKLGKWPEGFVLHKCNNPPCVNPDHLYIGSASDNWNDRRGEQQRRLKEEPLSEE